MMFEHRNIRDHKPVFLVFAALAWVALFQATLVLATPYDQIDEYIVQQQYSKAERLLQRLAQNGDTEAMYRLANLYRSGSTPFQNIDKALSWYTRASEAGHTKARYMLGHCYERGIGVPRDMVKAKHWYQAAADQGDTRAQERLDTLTVWSTDPLALDFSSDQAKLLQRFQHMQARNFLELDSHGRSLLMLAAASAGPEILSYLIQQGVDVNLQDNNQQSALFYAIREENLSSVDVLIRSGADPNLQDKLGNTPLHLAVVGGKVDVANLLLRKGADSLLKNNSGWSSSQLASTRGISDLNMPGAMPARNASSKADTQQRLKRLDKLLQQNQYRGWGRLALAAWLNDMALVEKLLPSEDVNIADKSGNTALSRAVLGKHSSVAKLLLRSGADPNTTSRDGNTPLLEAIRSRQTDLIDPLLNAGAESATAGQQGIRPLELAVQLHQTDTVKRLVQHGANPDLADESGLTPLLVAAHDKSIEMSKQLLEAGASLETIDANQRGLLWYASYNCDADYLTAILKLNQVFTPDAEGVTPLHNAVESNSVDCVKLLLNAGHPVNPKTQAGSTPLHMAAAAGAGDISTVLIENHANLNARDKLGSTPLLLAVLANKQTASEVLLAAGADPRIRNQNEQNPLDIVRAKGHSDWLALFDRHRKSLFSKLQN